jgi:hypothetical protein
MTETPEPTRPDLITPSSVTASYIYKADAGVPYYYGTLITSDPVAPTGSTKVWWECPHRHYAADAALDCATWERDHGTVQADAPVPASVPAGELLQVFGEIADWAESSGAQASLRLPGIVSLCSEVVRRWPDKNWRRYGVIPELSMMPGRHHGPVGTELCDPNSELAAGPEETAADAPDDRTPREIMEDESEEAAAAEVFAADDEEGAEPGDTARE